MTREEARLKVDGILGDIWLGFNNTMFRDALADAILAAVAEERERCLSHCQPMDTKHDGDMYWLGYTTARLEAERREATAIKACLAAVAERDRAWREWIAGGLNPALLPDRQPEERA